MFCPKCGKEIANKQLSNTKLTEKKDIFSLGNVDYIWWSLLGLVLPLIGVIVGLAMRKYDASKGKSVIVASLISFLSAIALGIVVYIALMDFGWIFDFNLREAFEPLMIKLGLN